MTEENLQEFQPVDLDGSIDNSKAKIVENIGPVTITANTLEEALEIKGERPTLEGFIKMKYHLNPEQYDSSTKAIIRGLETYISKMGFNCMVDKEEGVRQQMAFYQLLRAALDIPHTSMAIMNYDILLFGVSLNLDTVFNERLAGRFVNQLPENLQQSFLDMMVLIINTANPRTRARGLKIVDLQKLIDRAPKGNFSTNLLAYYSNNV